jgi:ATP-dependent DNA helicase RecG
LFIPIELEGNKAADSFTRYEKRGDRLGENGEVGRKTEESWEKNGERIENRLGENPNRLGENGKVGRKIGGSREKNGEKTENRLGENPNRLGEKVSGNAQKVIDLIINDSRITISELSEKLSISTTAVERHITRLKAKGLLKRVGPDRGGYWRVVVDNKMGQ